MMKAASVKAVVTAIIRGRAQSEVSDW